MHFESNSPIFNSAPAKPIVISGVREATGLFLQPDRCPLEGVSLPSPGSLVPSGALKCKRGGVMLGRGRLTAGVRTRCGVCGRSLDGFTCFREAVPRRIFSDSSSPCRRDSCCCSKDVLKSYKYGE